MDSPTKTPDLDTGSQAIYPTTPSIQSIVTRETAALEPDSVSDVAVSALGMVERRRQHGNRLVFLDIMVESDSDKSKLQILKNSGSVIPWAIRNSIVWVTGRIGTSKSGQASIYADDVKLVRVSPEPGPIFRILNLLSDGTMNEEDVVQALQLEVEALNDLVTLHGGRQRASVAMLSRRLQGRPAQRMRVRPFRVLPYDMDLLERYELKYARAHTGSCGGGVGSNAGNGDDEMPSLSLIDDNLPDPTDPVRKTYLEEKKKPQIKWMVNELKGKLRSKSNHDLVIVDVGGGRGDFALVAATEFPSALVVVIDRNTTSLEAGRKYVESKGVANIRFVNADMSTAMSGTIDSLLGVDCGDKSVVFVGLHACGGLSELIMTLACDLDSSSSSGPSSVKSASFLVATCCFRSNKELALLTKDNDEIDTLCRLAECPLRDVSIRAQKTVNCVRLSRLSEMVRERVQSHSQSQKHRKRMKTVDGADAGNDGDVDVGISAMPETISLRNLVVYRYSYSII